MSSIQPGESDRALEKEIVEHARIEDGDLQKGKRKDKKVLEEIEAEEDLAEEAPSPGYPYNTVITAPLGAD